MDMPLERATFKMAIVDLRRYLTRLREDPLDPAAIGRIQAISLRQLERGVKSEWILSGYWFILRTIIDALFDQGGDPARIQQQIQCVMKRISLDTLVAGHQQAAYYAFRDGVTACANRLATQVQLERLVRLQQPFTVFYLDLDAFKAVNDTYGHAAGDRVLKTVVLRWQHLMREADWLGRWGGDEFLVIVPEALAPTALARFAARMRQTSEDPITLDGFGPVSISASYGYAQYPEEGTTSAQILALADQRLYVAKHVATGHAMGVALGNAPQWRQRIHQGIVEQTIEVHYQPIISAHDAVGQWEALVRYRDRDGRIYMPGEFLAALPPEAVWELDRAVMRQVFHDMAAWYVAGSRVTVSINIDPADLLMAEWDSYRASLHAEFPQVAPEALMFEIRESLTPMGASRVVEMLRQLTRQGYHVALDDFGTGMSTVAGLQRLPLSAVKIDPAITREWASDSGRVLIQSVIGLSKPMGVQVIAEGVETVPQQRMLQQLGCHAEQGWLFSPALPASAVPGWTWVSSRN